MLYSLFSPVICLVLSPRTLDYVRDSCTMSQLFIIPEEEEEELTDYGSTVQASTRFDAHCVLPSFDTVSLRVVSCCCFNSHTIPSRLLFSHPRIPRKTMSTIRPVSTARLPGRYILMLKVLTPVMSKTGSTPVPHYSLVPLPR